MESNIQILSNYPDFDYAAGVDEAGRGPLAGPVTAACVVLKDDFYDQRIDDSKKLSPAKRDALFDLIKENCLAYSVISVGSHRIDQLNIREATRVAMALASERVSQKLNRKKIKFFVDGNVEMRTPLPQRTIIKGDSKVFSIAAASILAKVARDRIMEKLDCHYRGYDLAKHKGYPTKAHRQSIADLGPSPVHRKTFSGVKEFINKKNLSGLGEIQLS